jgi:hypothetical protein
MPEPKPEHRLSIRPAHLIRALDPEGPLKHRINFVQSWEWEIIGQNNTLPNAPSPIRLACGAPTL